MADESFGWSCLLFAKETEMWLQKRVGVFCLKLCPRLRVLQKMQHFGRVVGLVSTARADRDLHSPRGCGCLE